MHMLPDSHGRFGSYGGRYVPETLMPALLELEEVYAKAKKERRFQTGSRATTSNNMSGGRRVCIVPIG